MKPLRIEKGAWKKALDAGNVTFVQFDPTMKPCPKCGVQCRTTDYWHFCKTCGQTMVPSMTQQHILRDIEPAWKPVRLTWWMVARNRGWDIWLKVIAGHLVVLGGFCFNDRLGLGLLALMWTWLALKAWR